MNPPVTAAVGLGGNLGDPVSTLRKAFDALAGVDGVHLVRASPLYRTPAWGNTAQPEFINAAALLRTTLDPQALLEALLEIERRFGRDRGQGVHWGPRTLDLDLLVHGDAIIDAPGLRVPHPHLHQRAFVLLPLAQVAPDLQVPGQGRVADLLAGVDCAGCVAVGD